jgi:hypothetical protein
VQAPFAADHRIELVVDNERDESAWYPGAASPECEYQGDVRIELRRIDLDHGRESWRGAAREVKDRLLHEYPAPVTLGLTSGPQGCDLASEPVELAAGASVRFALLWDGRFGDGYPAPDGRHLAQVRFALLGPPGGEASFLQLALPVVVHGNRLPLPAGQVIDRALTEPRVVAWLAAHPPEAWTRNPELTYHPERSAWELSLDADSLRVTIANDGLGLVAGIIDAP